MSGSDARADNSWGDLGVSGLPTGTVTLLLADVEGSTRLWEAEPDAMTDAVARLDRALTDVVASHNGVRPVEQGEGDSFVVAFARASDAVACALELQLAALAPIRLRIGLHTGEVRMRDEGNYIGPTVNRTARLRDLAHGGQTLLSGATEGLVFDQLPVGAWLISLGAHRLRDVARPERVSQLCHADLRNEFPPLRMAKVTGVQRLPARFTSFVGRQSQMAEVRQLLADHRQVTLTGAGGAGKTRLAVEIAGQLVDDFPDGVWYADLAPITRPELVALTVSQALGLPEQAGSSSIDMLVRFAGDRTMLVLLDNCEHLADACADLAAALLGGCPAVKILATSREHIRAAGEITWQVPSLTLDGEAVELFGERVRQVRPDFQVTGDNADLVVEICTRLDGMPLAIELAAARIRTLSLAEIVDSLHDRFRVLTGGARTAVRRQQTLRASVDWSHSMLTEPEQALFRRLAVFLGGFDLDAAQAVAGGDNVERYQVLDMLTLLVDKSLVIAEEFHGRTRYRMLETMRQYALEKLGDSGEADTIRARHRDFFTVTAGQLDRAEADIDNLRAAFQWSRESSDREMALRLASSLQPLWLTRGRIVEGIGWLDAALTDGGEREEMSAARIGAIADKTVLLASLGQTDNIDAAQTALASAREIGDTALLVRALLACGSVVCYDVDLARPYLTEAEQLARELGDTWRLSQILNWQATTALMGGAMVATAEAAEEVLQLAETIGDDFVARQSRLWIANCCGYFGDIATAVRLFRDVIDEASAAHDVLLEVVGLVGESYALAMQGDVCRARTSADLALARAAELGEFYDPVCHGALLVGYLAAGDSAAAWAAAQAAQQRTAWHRMNSGAYISWSALAALQCGELGAATGLVNQAVSMTTGAYLSLALTMRARLACATGDHERATRDAHESLTIAATHRAHLLVPDILELLADLAAPAGSSHQAARLLGMADAARQRMGAVRVKALDGAYAHCAAVLRGALGEHGFEQAWAEGAALSADEAIAHAQRGRGERKRPAQGWASLTPTELDVVRLVGEGLANKDVAAKLFISPRTVESHLTHVYTKLGLSSRVQLVGESARRGHLDAVD